MTYRGTDFHHTPNRRKTRLVSHRVLFSLLAISITGFYSETATAENIAFKECRDGIYCKPIVPLMKPNIEIDGVAPIRLPNMYVEGSGIKLATLNNVSCTPGAILITNRKAIICPGNIQTTEIAE